MHYCRCGTWPDLGFPGSPMVVTIRFGRVMKYYSSSSILSTVLHCSSRYVAPVLGFSLSLVNLLTAQQAVDDPQRASLTGLRRFAVHAQVQVASRSSLPSVDVNLLTTKLQLAVTQEGLELQGPNDVRDGAAAQISLVYLVLAIQDQAGHNAGFAASSCIHASQLVRIPRVIGNRKITYAMAPTWSSCVMMVGDTASYRNKILGNADEQISRFRTAWRAANEAVKQPEIATPRVSL
jgi:hypothetical protein